MAERPDLETREEKNLRLNTEIMLKNLRNQVDQIPALEARIEDWREAWEHAIVRAESAESRAAALERELGAAREVAANREKRWEEIATSILEVYHGNSPHHRENSQSGLCLERICSNWRQEIRSFAAAALAGRDAGGGEG